MRIALSVAALAVIAVSTPALAFQDNGEDEVVCKRSEAPSTGSNIRRSSRVCKKASEWKALERQNDNALRRVTDKMRGGAAPEVGGFGAN